MDISGCKEPFGPETGKGLSVSLLTEICAKKSKLHLRRKDLLTSPSLCLNLVIYLAIVFQNSPLKYSKCYSAAARTSQVQQVGKNISLREELLQR